MKPSSKVVLVSAVLSLPVATALEAQEPVPVRSLTPTRSGAYCCLKMPTLTRQVAIPAGSLLVGIDNGTTIYQSTKGERFYLDPKSGDMVFLSDAAFSRFTETPRIEAGSPIRMLKLDPKKISGQLTVLGMDASGRVIHQNERGEKFYLDALTADIILVK